MALPGRVLLSAAESCINLLILKTFRSSEKLGHNFPDLFRLQHRRGSLRAAVAGLGLMGGRAADENGLKLPP